MVNGVDAESRLSIRSLLATSTGVRERMLNAPNVQILPMLVGWVDEKGNEAADHKLSQDVGPRGADSGLRDLDLGLVRHPASFLCELVTHCPEHPTSNPLGNIGPTLSVLASRSKRQAQETSCRRAEDCVVGVGGVEAFEETDEVRLQVEGGR